MKMKSTLMNLLSFERKAATNRRVTCACWRRSSWILVVVATFTTQIATAKTVPEATAKHVALVITLGATDKSSTAWDGELTCSDGAIIKSAGVQDFIPKNNGGLELKSGQRLVWHGKSRCEPIRNEKKQPVLDPQGNGLRWPLTPYRFIVQMVVPKPAAVLTVTTPHGKFAVDLDRLQPGASQEAINGRVLIERAVPTTEAGENTKTGPIRYWDYPAICAAPDGTTWSAMVCYTGKDSAQIKLKEEPKHFGFLKQATCNDQLFVVSEKNGVCSKPIAVTARGLDLYQPAIACDRNGRVVVFWSQGTASNWDLYASVMEHGQWSSPARLTTDAAPDIYPATVAMGNTIWVTWQTFVEGRPRIMLGRLAADACALESVVAVTDSKVSSWMPAIAADSKGNLAVAYDTYEKGDYDVYCSLFSAVGVFQKRIPVATSFRYEAHASVAYDASDRLWLAWEESGEGWGKKYSRHDMKEGSAINEGTPIEAYRTLNVGCVAEGGMFTTKAPVETYLPVQQGMRSVYDDMRHTIESLMLPGFRFDFEPKLACGADGRIYVLYREKSYLPYRSIVTHNIWTDRVMVYEGNRWLSPMTVNGSAGFRHCTPAICALPAGGVTVASTGDLRDRNSVDFASRHQNVRIGHVAFSAAAVPPVLVKQPTPVPPSPPPSAAAENTAVKRVRDYRITVAGKEMQILRGDFHRHTAFSGDGSAGDGSIKDAFRYALDAAALDTMMNGDHDNGQGAEYPWYVVQKLYDIHLLPGHFVSMFGTERSRDNNATAGHRNIIMAERGFRVLPGYGVDKVDENGSVQDTRMLFRSLHAIDALCIPHTIATRAGPNFADYDPKVEPVVEIYQGARNSYEYFDCPRGSKTEGSINPRGFFWSLLKAHKKYGVIASSDHLSTHISYAMLYVPDMSRKSVMDALRQRHCYAATDNILLDVRLGDHMMGDMVTAQMPPTFKIFATGTGVIKQLDIIRNAAIVKTIPLGKDTVQLDWTDSQPPAGENSYYVRVMQEDGNLAWGSPLWVIHK